MGDLVTVAKELAPVMRPLQPMLEQLLPATLPPEQLLQTLYVSVANNPSLEEATRPSLIQAATSAAVLALTIDGVSGQGYLVPFKNRGTRLAQFIGGYKGFVTLAGRARRTLRGFVVREGDGFEFDEVRGQVRHTRRLGDEASRRIVAAYAVSQAEGLPDLAQVLSIDQLLAVRNESAGWRMKKERSTWGTNFDAMCRKTPMRLLSNDIPVLPLQQAAALEVQNDLGRHAWLHQDGGIIVDGKERDPADVVRQAREREEVQREQPGAGEILEGEVVPDEDWTVSFPGGKSVDARNPERYEGLLKAALAKEQTDEHRRELIELNRGRIQELAGGDYSEAASRLVDLLASYE